MHPIMVLVFVLLAAVALVPVSYLAVAPDVMQVYVAPAHGGPAQRGDVATPNHDPHRIRLVNAPPAETVATSEEASLVGPMPSFALNPVALRAEPELAVPSVPAFVATETTLYARDSARLRAAPSTEADVLKKLAADAPLRATARSTDGAWWQVSLGGGRIGYVHQAAVTQTRGAKPQPQPQPQAARAPVVAAARPSPQPDWERRSQDLLGYVDKTMSWLADQAGGGTAPKIVRSER